MSDNDFASGDPWGLDSFESDGAVEAPPAPEDTQPPVPSDDLPEDLADLSTLANAASSPDSPEAPADEPVEAPSDETAESTTEEAFEPVGAPESDPGTDLDLGDMDLGDMNPDDGPDDTAIELTAVGDRSLEGGPLEVTDMPEVTLDDPGESPGADSPDPVTAGEPPVRRLNPMLAASGLFGGSPELPPMASSDESVSSEDDQADLPLDLPLDLPEISDLADQLPELDLGDLAVDPPSVNEFPDDGNSFDIGDPLAIQFDEGAIDFGSIEFTTPTADNDNDDAGYVFDSSDIEAELAETLQSLGDQPASSITFDDSPSDEEDDPVAAFEDTTDLLAEFAVSADDAVLTEHGSDEPADEEVPGFEPVAEAAEPEPADPESVDPEAVDPEAIATGSEGEDPAAGGPADDEDLSVLSDGSADPEFDVPSDPPTVYHELEGLGEGQGSPGGDNEPPEPVYGAVFHDSDDDQRDPFGVVFGSGDAAIAAVAAAAASVEMRPAVPVVPFENPGADDLPDFLMDDDQPGPIEVAASPEPVEPVEAIEPVEPVEPVDAVEAVEAVEPMELVEAVEPIETVEPMEPVESGQAVESGAFDALAAVASDDDASDATESDSLAADETGPSPVAVVGTATTGVIGKKAVPEDWGTRSDDAYEGWVQDADGVETWRMIITNLSTIAGYEIDEFLGLAVADSMVASHDVQVVAAGRRAAMDALTEDGVLRGAHAIVAVSHAVQPVGDQMLVTVSGTAVTLKPISPSPAGQ